MIQQIITYPNDILTTKSTEIPSRDKWWGIKSDLWDTLKHYTGLGLAAPQIGLPYRIFMIDGNLYSAPEILSYSSSTSIEEEGCLSLPNRKFLVERSNYINVRYLSFTGDIINKKLSGFQARIYQHELQHLDGILILNVGKEILK